MTDAERYERLKDCIQAQRSVCKGRADKLEAAGIAAYLLVPYRERVLAMDLLIKEYERLDSTP